MKVPTIKLVFDRKKSADNYKSPSRSKQGLLQLEIYYERQRKWYSTGVRLYEGQWSDIKGVINHNDSAELNKQIRSIVANATRVVTLLTENGNTFSFSDFDLKFSSSNAEKDIYELVDEHIESKKESGSSYTSYETLKSHLVRYGKINRVKDLTYDGVVGFDKYMKSLGLADSSVSIYHSKLSAVCTQLIRNGLMEKNPYSLFRVKKIVTEEIKYLDEEELRKVRDFVPATAKQQYAKDFFLVQTMTGMSFADLKAFNLNTDAEVIDGKYIVRRNRRIKTDVNFRIVIMQPAVDILNKYGGQMNKYSIMYVNTGLHTIGMATIGRELTSHIGRHTFATWALSNEVPIEYVQKMLGHSRIDTTQKYAKALAKDVIRQFDKLENALKK